ncbi:MAG: hypothetical protein AAGJ83_15295, partial [Planctomycetota bacterium]
LPDWRWQSIQDVVIAELPKVDMVRPVPKTWVQELRLVRGGPAKSACAIVVALKQLKQWLIQTPRQRWRGLEWICSNDEACVRRVAGSGLLPPLEGTPLVTYQASRSSRLQSPVNVLVPSGFLWVPEIGISDLLRRLEELSRDEPTQRQPVGENRSGGWIWTPSSLEWIAEEMWQPLDRASVRLETSA